MIKVFNAVKTFEGFRALDGLNMNVPAGSVYGLVGPNGAGKSTIIRHITGTLRQDSGEVLVMGYPVYENVAVKGGIATIPDEVFFFPSASGRDMKNFYKGIYKNFSEERYQKLRDALPVDDKLTMRKLSRGMQKQVAFRIALSTMPQLLVLDEPVDGLDPVMRRQIMSLIMDDVAERGMTVLISSHNLRELEDVCDHVGIMNKGRILLEHALCDLQDNIAKVLVAMPEGESLPEDLDILHSTSTGRLHTLIIRGGRDEIRQKISAAGPQFMDLVPLTLEEIFIYELGGADYAVKDIVL